MLIRGHLHKNTLILVFIHIVMLILVFVHKNSSNVTPRNKSSQLVCKFKRVGDHVRNYVIHLLWIYYSGTKTKISKNALYALPQYLFKNVFHSMPFSTFLGGPRGEGDRRETCVIKDTHYVYYITKCSDNLALLIMRKHFHLHNAHISVKNSQQCFQSFDRFL